MPSKDGLVVCMSAPACDAGAAVLARGGNAVDAAVATGLRARGHAPVRRQHRRRRLHDRPHAVRPRSPTFDYREKAPLTVDARRCISSADGKIDRELTAAGYLAPGVPGTVRGLELAHKRFGKLPLEARSSCRRVALAEEGFPVSDGARAQSQRASCRAAWRRFPASVAAYGKPGGGEWAAGDRLRARRSRPRRCARSPTDGAGRVLQGLDRRSDRRGHEGQRRADHQGGSRRLRGEGAHAGHAAPIAASRSSRCRRRAPAASR